MQRISWNDPTTLYYLKYFLECVNTHNSTNILNRSAHRNTFRTFSLLLNIKLPNFIIVSSSNRSKTFSVEKSNAKPDMRRILVWSVRESTSPKLWFHNVVIVLCGFWYNPPAITGNHLPHDKSNSIDIMLSSRLSMTQAKLSLLFIRLSHKIYRMSLYYSTHQCQCVGYFSQKAKNSSFEVLEWDRNLFGIEMIQRHSLQ